MWPKKSNFLLPIFLLISPLHNSTLITTFGRHILRLILNIYLRDFVIYLTAMFYTRISRWISQKH